MAIRWSLLTARIARRRALVLGIAAAGATIGCGDDEARVAVRYIGAATLPQDLLTVHVTDGRRLYTIRGRALGGPDREGASFATRTSGTLWLRFRMADGSAVASEGEVELPLRADWSYGVEFRVAADDPTRFCFGCQGAKAFPLAAAFRGLPADSLWVVWGGNSIRNPVVY
jgi:hypothetical protein